MKKSVVITILSVLAVFACAFAFVACGGGGKCDVGGNGGGHKHSAQNYSADENSHWKVCDECGETFNSGKHKLNVSGACTVCEYTSVYTQGLEYREVKDDDGNVIAYSVSGKGTATDTDIIIPSYYNGKAVTSIGWGAFWNCSSLTSITIPNNVTSIVNDAFSGCSGLTSITIPNSVTSIGYGAFYNTAYYKNESNWENGVLYIDKHLIKANSTISGAYTIKQGTLYIAEFAFSSCRSLTSITLPNSVKTIDRSFTSCENLKDVYYTGNIAEWCAIEFLAGDGHPNKAANLYINNQLITGNLIIPDAVKRIGRGAFYNCNGLISVTIPNSVTSIGADAFYKCEKLKDVFYLGNIANWCEMDKSDDPYGSPMRYADKLYINNKLVEGEIVIPDSVNRIGRSAFCYCRNVTSIVVPNSVKSIGSSAFFYCVDLESISLPNTLSQIEEHTFSGCSSLTSIEMSNNVTSIGDYAFSNCSGLTSIEMSNSVTSIGDNAFWNCSSLTSIEIPNGVTSIGDITFSGCSSLTSIEIPNSVTSIGQGAFSDCSSLTSITIPNSVTRILYNAFAYCSSLTIYCEAASKPYGYIDWNSSNCPVVWDCKNNDKDSNEYAYAIIEGIRYSLKDGVATVVRQPSNISGNITILSSVTYKNASYSVTSIIYTAFHYCNSLTSIEIPDSVASIAYGEFSHCRGLTSVTVDCSNPYYSSQDGILYNKAKTQLISVPDAISGTIALPNTITGIGSSAFQDCRSLTSIKIPDSVTSIGYNAFDGCSSLTSIEIPNSVTSIGDNAFCGCSSLTIYCEATSKPSGWNSSWNYSSCPIVWGYKG